MRKILLLIMMLGATMMAWAQTLSGSGTEADPYLIQNDADWVTFAGLINDPETNASYRKKCYKQTNDINVTTMVGMTSSTYFNGTYDGDGHTMNVSLTSTEDYCAPFRYIYYGSTFRRINVTGSITTSGSYAAGLIGYMYYNTNYISYCRSSVTINSSVNNNYSSHGGFIGYTNANVNITNCLFDGSLLGNNSGGCGGFVGYQSSNAELTNCLFAPAALTVSETNSFTFVRSNGFVLTNCYYTEILGTEQGTSVGAMTVQQLKAALGDGWEIANNTVVPVQDIKNLKAGSINCNSFIPYTGSEITLNPTIKDMDGNVVASENYDISCSPSPVQALGNYTMTITGKTANGYSGTLTHEFQVANMLSGSGTSENPYIIATTADWNTFAASVAGGIDYSGEYVKLDSDDVVASTMVGVNEDYPFSGTFEGASHTLNVSITSTATGEDLAEVSVAPFHYVMDATIQNLTVTGTVNSASKYAAGLVGWATDDLWIYGCVVTTVITTSADYAGGIVGNMQRKDYGGLSFQNTVFAGTINNTSDASERRAGAFFGHGAGYSYFIDCFENGTYTNLTTMNPRGAENTYFNNEIYSLYYCNKFGNVSKFISDNYGCFQVKTSVPSSDLYLTRTIKGNTFYQPATVSGLFDLYAYNNGEAINLSYTVKMSKNVMTEDTDYEVSYSPSAPAAVGAYTINFTAKEGNEAGYIGTTSCPFRVIEGESLDGYVFAKNGDDYLINDESDLERLAAYVNSGHKAEGKTFILNDNITMVGAHTSIGTDNGANYHFAGTFDGNNKTITNLTTINPYVSHQGLFGYIVSGAVIKDVTLANCNISGNMYVGGITGYAYNATIQNCRVSGTIRAKEYYAGGILGCAYNDVTVESCENTADIINGGYYTGGIVGYDSNNNNHYSQCLNTGTVTGLTIGTMGAIGSTSWYTYNYSNCYYATPCNNVKALGNYDYPGATRAYIINKGEHVSNIAVTENASATSAFSGTKYYKAGSWTLNITPDLTDATFITYVCEGGTLTNLTTVDGDHTLTITSNDVTIKAIVSSNNGYDLSEAVIASIPNQRWRGNAGNTPALDVTYNSTPLVEGTDYIVSWTDNTAVGTATATVRGINNYKGNKSATFEIVDFPLVNQENPNSSSNPYLINSESDLQALACIVNSNARRNGYYRQNSSITFQEEHTAIGTGSYNFTGEYDGNHLALYNLTINKPNEQYQGLFGYITSATVKNVIINNCDITGGDYTGGVAGYMYNNNCKMIDCSVSGAIKTPNDQSRDTHGGLVGKIQYGTIDNCVNTASVTGNGNEHGGLVGYLNDGTIKNCFNAGVVEGTKKVGSIVGDHNDGIFTDNYHTTATTGGIGANSSNIGTDQPGAEVVAKITADTGVTLVLPAVPTYSWNEENLYKNGTVVTLNYAVPAGKVFDHYTVNNGEISKAGILEGEHTLTGFNDNVLISGTYADSYINLETAGAEIAAIANLTFNRQVQHPEPVVTLNEEVLVKNVHYTVSYSDGCTNVNDALAPYIVTVTGTGRYQGTLTQEFNIVPFNISGNNAVAITGVEDEYMQTGSAIHPVPTVKCTSLNNVTLVLDTDYELSYNGACTLPGNYQVIITGIGNYIGTKTLTFSILDCNALTVYDYNNTSEFTPVYGYYAETYQKNELIMPAGELAAMNGKAITAMKFYIAEKANGSWGKARYRVFMKEVGFTTFEEPNNTYQGTEGATIVYDGALDGTQSIMTVRFTTPYYYNGGNLLIGFYEYEKGSWSRAYFYGRSIAFTSIGGNHSTSIDDVQVGYRNFLPKTTFLYADYENPSVSAYTSDADGWMFIASPLVYDVDPVNVGHLTDATPANYDLYRFDQSQNGEEWQNYKVNNFVLENGKGYLYSHNGGTTLTFAGTLNTGASSKTVDLVYDNNADEKMKGVNLVGNPFNTAAYINRPYYKMNNDGSAIVAVNDLSTAIPVCNGVVVVAEGNSETATFTTSAPSKSTDSSNSLQMTLDKAGVRGNAFQDNAIISFSEGTQLGKFVFNEDNAKLYIPQNGNDYAIVSSDRQNAMTLEFKTKEMGRYTISFDGNTFGVSLIDNIEGNIVDLSTEKTYTFMGVPTDRNDRFTIVFNANGNFAYQNGDDVIVNGEGELQIFDVMGRLVSTQYVSGVETISKPSQCGVYIFRLNDNTQKIVVR